MAAPWARKVKADSGDWEDISGSGCDTRTVEAGSLRGEVGLSLAVRLVAGRRMMSG